MTMNTTFGFGVRVLVCPNCAAPIEAPVVGGVTACSFCGYRSQVASRNQASLVPPQRVHIDEAERLRRLRAQDGKPLIIPSAIQGLMEGGMLAPWKIDEAVRIWNATRQELGGSQKSPQAAEQLLVLTMLLANHYTGGGDVLRARALYESALEVFFLPRHQQMMRGFLARSAAREGDIEAAEQWLAPCDPASDDLQSDTAYRVSRAVIDTARGDFQGVLRVLGQSLNAIPIMDEMDLVATVYQVNARERLGDVSGAAKELRKYLRSLGPAGRSLIEKVREQSSAWDLCGQSLALLGAPSSKKGAASAGSGPVASKKGAVFLGLAYGSLLPTAGLIYFSFYLFVSGRPLSSLVPLFVSAGVLAFLSMGMTFLAIVNRTAAAGVHALFDTWFPMFMVAVPVGGPFIALWSALKLLRGKLGAATITVSGGGSRSRTRYDAVKLYGSGVPGGILLIVLATVQPLFVLLPILAHIDPGSSKGLAGKAARLLGKMGSREREWDGEGTLRCRRGDRYRVVNKTIVRKGGTVIRADSGCSVKILGSTITGGSIVIRVGRDAKVTLENTTIKSPGNAIRVDSGGELRMTGGVILAGGGRFSAIALRALGAADVTLTKVRVHGGTAIRADGDVKVMVIGGKISGDTAIRVSGRSTVMLRSVELVGKNRKYGGGTVIYLKPGDDPEAIAQKQAAIAQRVARYSKQACVGVFACYADHGYEGRVRGRIVMAFNEQGKVTKTRLRLRRVPKKVKRCIRRVAKAKVLEGFDGPAGVLRCSYSGTVMGGTRMLNISTDYLPLRGSSIRAEKR